MKKLFIVLLVVFTLLGCAKIDDSKDIVLEGTVEYGLNPFPYIVGFTVDESYRSVLPDPSIYSFVIDNSHELLDEFGLPAEPLKEANACHKFNAKLVVDEINLPEDDGIDYVPVFSGLKVLEIIESNTPEVSNDC